MATTTPATNLPEENNEPVLPKVKRKIADVLKDNAVSKKDKIKAKGQEVALVGVVAKTERTKNKIEIESIKATDFGVELYARAWDKDDNPIGFGDGTVEIERFRLVMNEGNGFIYVKDPAGDIDIPAKDDDGTEYTIKVREDPKEAVLRRLEDVIDSTGKDGSNIIKGKRGNTTTVIDITFTNSRQMYADAKASYALAHDATTADTSDTYNEDSNNNCLHNSDLTTFFVRRAEMQFDTSVIPDAHQIDGLTMTMYIAGSGGGDTDSDSVSFLDNTNNGDIQDPLATEDFNDFGTTAIISKDLTDYHNAGANVTTQDFGTYDVVDKTGTTRIGLRLANDIANSTPTGSNLLRVAMGSAGDDPYITVTHSYISNPGDIKNHSTLTTNLVSYWDLEEASGTRYDLHGSNDLTDNNTVTQATGKNFGNCASFDETNTEYLSRSNADTAGLSATGADKSWSFWVKRTDGTDTTRDRIIGAWGGGAKNAQFVFWDSGQLAIAYGTGSTTGGTYTGASTDISTGAWFHIVVTFDSADDKFRIYVNDSLDGTSSAYASLSGSTADWRINYVDDALPADIDVDEVGVWDKVLSSQEITDLYNSGDGLPYYVPNDVKNDTTLSTSLVSYWEMEQSAGATATDSHGSNDLSDNNTVGTATGILGEGADYEDGSSQYHEITDASQTGLDISGDYSISLWLKPETLGTQVVFAKGESDAALNYRLIYFATGEFTFARSTNSGDYNLTTTSTPLATGVWTHIVLVADVGTGAKVYINGVLDTSDSNSATTHDTNADDFLIGTRKRPAAELFLDGVVDEFAIWNKVLTVGEARALYGYGTPPNYADAGAGPATLKTLDGAALATIKTINGTAIANVKTWNGAA